MMINYANPSAYFAALPEERREALGQVRHLIFEAWPKAVEDMSHGMPTYFLEGEPFCAIASQKHFMALYIMPYDLLNVFAMDLKIHDTGLSCIRFKRLDDTTMILFDRIIKYTGSQLATSIYFGATKKASGTKKASRKTAPKAPPRS